MPTPLPQPQRTLGLSSKNVGLGDRGALWQVPACHPSMRKRAEALRGSHSTRLMCGNTPFEIEEAFLGIRRTRVKEKMIHSGTELCDLELPEVMADLDSPAPPVAPEMTQAGDGRRRTSGVLPRAPQTE